MYLKKAGNYDMLKKILWYMGFFFLEGVFLGLGIYLIEKNNFLSVILLSLILFISLSSLYSFNKNIIMEDDNLLKNIKQSLIIYFVMGYGGFNSIIYIFSSLYLKGILFLFISLGTVTIVTLKIKEDVLKEI